MLLENEESSDIHLTLSSVNFLSHKGVVSSILRRDGNLDTNFQ